jgi:hypothetical protein
MVYNKTLLMASLMAKRLRKFHFASFHRIALSENKKPPPLRAMVEIS